MGEPTARRVLFAVAARRAPHGGPEVDAALEAALEAARRRGSARDEALTWLRAAEVLAQARDPDWRRKLLRGLHRALRDACRCPGTASAPRPCWQSSTPETRAYAGSAGSTRAARNSTWRANSSAVA